MYILGMSYISCRNAFLKVYGLNRSKFNNTITIQSRKNNLLLINILIG